MISSDSFLNGRLPHGRYSLIVLSLEPISTARLTCNNYALAVLCDMTPRAPATAVCHMNRTAVTLYAKMRIVFRAAVCHMHHLLSSNEALWKEAVRQIIRIMTNDPDTTWEHRAPRKLRLYRNFAEPIILRKLYSDLDRNQNKEPLHEYALAKACRLHRTQVTRALRSLSDHEAIKVVKSTRWRTGKQKKLYTVTSLGRLLLLYESLAAIET